MPTTIQELRERRERAEAIEEKVFNVINNERCSNSWIRFWC